MAQEGAVVAPDVASERQDASAAAVPNKNSDTIDQVVKQLENTSVKEGPAPHKDQSSPGNANYKQSRMLGEQTHHYEHFSLPPSRVPSYDASVGPSGTATPRSTYETDDSGAEDRPDEHVEFELHSPGKRPSAAFLAGAGGYDAQSSGESGPPSGEQSPKAGTSFYLGNDSKNSIESISNAPGQTKSRDSSSPSTSPATSVFPSGDQSDPYSRKNRPPPTMNVKEIAPRFVFSKKRSKNGSSTSLKSLGIHHHDTDKSTDRREKSGSKSLLSQVAQGLHISDSEDGGLENVGKKSSSKLELKRFFKTGFKFKHHNHHGHGHSKKSPKHTKHSEVPSTIYNSGTSTPDMPFSEDGFKKYGKIGRVLGSGAGGSVRLMKRASDGTVFAVKEFRERQPTESEREYSKKVTAEFCVGSTLHHPNIIETLDIIREGGRYFEVMEYGPYDFFAIVMSGKMTQKEVGCCFRQLLAGVTYLQEMGLAHRDLKLDNCVVSEQGILKIIDFGSAVVYQYPFEDDIVMAKGVVGSDPYLAPEVFSETRYDPRLVDIWSVAVIFCCMTLRRFPWKAPRLSDNSFRLFANEPNVPITGPINEAQQSFQSSEIRGPWRLLRLLPHGSRHIIGRMLAVDPRNRAHMAEVNADEWINSLEMCTINKSGAFLKSEDHEHTFVAAEQAHLEAYKQN